MSSRRGVAAAFPGGSEEGTPSLDCDNKSSEFQRLRELEEGGDNMSIELSSRSSCSPETLINKR